MWQWQLVSTGDMQPLDFPTAQITSQKMNVYKKHTHTQTGGVWPPLGTATWPAHGEHYQSEQGRVQNTLTHKN